jgi:hypothetical protein
MVHGHLELRLCAMHLRSATEPTGHLSRGCMAGQTPNHLGNQAQLRVLVDSGFTRIHFRASATRCSGGELGSDRPKVRMIGRSLSKALITAWALISVAQTQPCLTIQLRRVASSGFSGLAPKDGPVFQVFLEPPTMNPAALTKSSCSSFKESMAGRTPNVKSVGIS